MKECDVLCFGQCLGGKLCSDILAHDFCVAWFIAVPLLQLVVKVIHVSDGNLIIAVMLCYNNSPVVSNAIASS